MMTNMRSNVGFKIKQISFGFIRLSPFSDWGTKTVLDLEVVEEEGLEEIAYPKPVLLELGF